MNLNCPRGNHGVMQIIEENLVGPNLCIKQKCATSFGCGLILTLKLPVQIEESDVGVNASN